MISNSFLLVSLSIFIIFSLSAVVLPLPVVPVCSMLRCSSTCFSELECIYVKACGGWKVNY